MGVVTWAWPLLQLKFCECQKLLWIRTCLGFNSRLEGSYYRISPVFIGAALSTMYCMQAFLSTDLCYEVDICFETHKW